MKDDGGEGQLRTLAVPFLRSRRNAKWQRYGDDILPAWVAEMDFGAPEPVQAAMERLVREQDYGYPLGTKTDTALAEAFAARMKDRFDWEVDPALVQPVGDLVQACFGSVMAFSDPGDAVVLQTPAYPPFRAAITETGRRILAHPMRDDGSRYVLDMAALEASFDPRTRIILFCHPQNPTGRVYDEAELRAVGQFAIDHDLVIVSDEIHADLVYDGRRHIPLAKLSPEIAGRTVTITSATKSFNIPGLRCGVAYFGSAALKRRFHERIPGKLLGHPGLPGFDATIAAWTQGQPWLDAALQQLRQSRDHLVARIRSDFPEARLYVPEATFLAWIDFSALGLEPTAFKFFHDRARVALSAGETFDAACGDFGRINFATSIPILDQILDRMKEAIRARN